MNAFKNLTLVVAALIALSAADAAQAQIRSAASKASGDYNHFYSARSSATYAQPRSYAPVQPLPQATAPSTARSYSYSAAPQPEASCAATPSDMPGMPSMSNRPAPAQRQFSYEPSPVVRRQAVIANSPVHSAAERNAAAKALGQY